MDGSANAAWQTLRSDYVRFAVLSVSSVIFLVDRFAAIPAFLAVTAGERQVRIRPHRSSSSRGLYLPKPLFQQKANLFNN